MAEVEQNLEEQNDVTEVQQSPEQALEQTLEQALEQTLEQTPEENVEELPADSLPEEKPQEESPAAGAAEKRWPGWPGDSVFRMLVPAQKVGSIIGRKGEFIKKIVEETRARIKILDGPPGTAERAVPSANLRPRIYPQ